ncbi:UBN2_3 domain-containing protein, partial [Cephalotus follicularis]
NLSLKLTAKNYFLWRIQIVPFFRGQKLLSFVDGSKPCPPDPISINGHNDPQPNPTASIWKGEDQLLLSLLISPLSEDVIPVVVGLNISHAVWSALESAFASPSNTRVLHLHMQMQCNN